MTAEEVLRKYQKQLDPEGIEVGVSRQALDEVLTQLTAAQEQVERYYSALYSIKHLDYRGNRHQSASIASEAIGSDKP